MSGKYYTTPKLRKACTPDAKLENGFPKSFTILDKRGVPCPSSPPRVQICWNPLTISTGHCIGNPQRSMRQEGQHHQIFSPYEAPKKTPMKKKKGSQTEKLTIWTPGKASSLKSVWSWASHVFISAQLNSRRASSLSVLHIILFQKISQAPGTYFRNNQCFLNEWNTYRYLVFTRQVVRCKVYFSQGIPKVLHPSSIKPPPNSPRILSQIAPKTEKKSPEFYTHKTHYNAEGNPCSA